MNNTIDVAFWATALGNLAAGYNLSVVGHMLGFIEKSGVPLEESEESMVATSGLLGTLMGQIVFGYLALAIGLRRGLGLCFAIVGIGAFLSSLAIWHDEILVKLAVCRLITGFGIGGVFPISAVLAAEGKNNVNSKSRVIHSFAFQVWGQLLSSVTALILNTIMPSAPSISWRLCGLIGLFPSLLSVVLVVHARRNRNTLNEHVQVQSLEGIVEEDELDSDDEVDISLKEKKSGTRWSSQNMFKLAGTAGSWFLFDLVYYGNIIFAPFVLKVVFTGAEDEYVLELSTLLGVVSLPGVYLACFFIDAWGPKKMQLFGFSTLLLLFTLVSISLAQEVHSNGHKVLLFALYCGTFFFYNFGPNSTTFILPGQAFGASESPFFGGLSAASGKSGALIGSALFKWMLDQFGVLSVMICCIIICSVALVFTFFFVEKDRLGLSNAEVKEISMVEIA